MKSVNECRVGQRLAVLKLIGSDPKPEGEVLFSIGWVGEVVRVYRSRVNRGQASVELEFPHGLRFVYVAEEVEPMAGSD